MHMLHLSYLARSSWIFCSLFLNICSLCFLGFRHSTDISSSSEILSSAMPNLVITLLKVFSVPVLVFVCLFVSHYHAFWFFLRISMSLLTFSWSYILSTLPISTLCILITGLFGFLIPTVIIPSSLPYLSLVLMTVLPLQTKGFYCLLLCPVILLKASHDILSNKNLG